MSQPAFAEHPEVLARALPTGICLFGRYFVIEKIADGCASSVYWARDAVTDTEVALKVFDPLHGADPVARRRFEREFVALSNLSHPGIARSFSFVHGDDFDVLVLELLKGESLKDRLARGRFDVSEAFELAIRLSEALEICHRAGIVHRDLKPSNIILHPERGPVILDFGVAWFSSAMTLTRTGAIVGSPQYLAPEMFERASSDERADVFALGAILFELLTGRPLRTSSNMAELAAEGERDAPLVSALVSNFDPEWDPLVGRAVAFRPEDRFATARELGHALKRRRATLGRRLEASLPCSCQTPLIIDLPICPGCGKATDWALEPGPYAVQLLEIEDVEGTASWLRRRYDYALKKKGALLHQRLVRPPLALAVGVSRTSAETLAAGAQSKGAKTRVVRAQKVVGPALKIPSATPGEVLAAAVLHLLVVLVIGAVLIFCSVPFWVTRLMPAAVALGGVLAVLRYVRRPLLRVRKAKGGRTMGHPAISKLSVRLHSLSSPRARRLAAAAVARAAPILVERRGSDATGADEDVEREVLDALDDAISSASDLDAHEAFLRAHPRSELRRNCIAAESKGDVDEIAALARAEDELTEVSVAYDLAARSALEACHMITDALARRHEAVRAVEALAPSLRARRR